VNQRAMAFLQRLEPESPVHHIAFAARAAGPLDGEAVRRALKRLVDRHAALRIGLGDYSQNPNAHFDPDFAAVDAANFKPEELGARLLDESHRPFDLERDALLRVRLFREAGS